MLARNSRELLPATGFVTGVALMTLVAVYLVVIAGTPASAEEETDESFQVTCTPTHDLADDPIVFPGQPGASHMHLFAGNRNTDAFSTADELSDDANDANETSCRAGYAAYDASGYWTPALYVDGEEVRPSVVVARYETRDKPRLKAYPAGMQIVFGDARAQTPQPVSIVRWSCNGSETMGSSSEIPDCGRNRRVTLRLNAPDCWDGERLDSPNHKEHLAYSSNGSCPASHPVETTGLKLTFVYPITDGAGVTLSSGSTMTAHADFMNGWDQRVFDAEARRISQ